MMSRFPSREMTRDALLERVPRHRADDLVDELAGLEEQDRRDPHDHELLDLLRVLVAVHLREGDLPRILLREFLDNRRDREAGSAPRGPKIDDYVGVLLDEPIEVRISEMDRTVGHANPRYPVVGFKVPWEVRRCRARTRLGTGNPRRGQARHIEPVLSRKTYIEVQSYADGILMMSGTPVIILKEGTERDKGRGAASNNIAAARAVADAVKSTLGPKGMDKMLVDSLGDVTITNDGVTILKEIDVEHPAAKMLVEVAKTQDAEVGDGTTSAVIIAGELLKQAEDLIEQEVHPTILVSGYRMAAAEAIRALDRIAFPVKRDDLKTLKSIAATAMSGRTVGDSGDFLADIAVKAVLAIVDEVAGELRADIDNILVQKKHGGSVRDMELIEGIVLDKEKVHARMPNFVRDAKIALINRALETKKTEVSEEIKIRDPSKLQKFLEEEERGLKAMADKIQARGATVVLGQKGIDDLVQHYLAKAGIYAVRRVKESDMKKLAKATGGRVVTNLDDLSAKELGRAALVEERKVGSEEMTFITGCKKARAVTVLVRGGTEHVVDEIH